MVEPVQGSGFRVWSRRVRASCIVGAEELQLLDLFKGVIGAVSGWFLRRVYRDCIAGA